MIIIKTMTIFYYWIINDNKLLLFAIIYIFVCKICNDLNNNVHTLANNNTLDTVDRLQYY